MEKFTLEDRYIVLKRSDIQAANFTQYFHDNLKVCTDVLHNSRLSHGKQPLKCLVIESDWPEYEPVLQMLKDRAEGIDRVTNAQLHGSKFEGWQCFHCSEVFTTVGGARDHFGATQDAIPGCMLKVEQGAERGLLMALRKAEQDAAEAWSLIHNEGTEAAKSIQSQLSRHLIQLRTAEERGYEKGLADGRALGSSGAKQNPTSYDTDDPGCYNE